MWGHPSSTSPEGGCELGVWPKLCASDLSKDWRWAAPSRELRVVGTVKKTMNKLVYDVHWCTLMYSKLDVWICSLDDRFRKLRHAAMQPNSRKHGVKTRRKRWFFRFRTWQRYAVLYDSSKASYLNGALDVMTGDGTLKTNRVAATNQRCACEVVNIRIVMAPIRDLHMPFTSK